MSDAEFDLIALGDTTTDVFLGLKDASVVNRPKERGQELCVRYADKIGVEGKKEIEGVGNAANVAVGCARLGLKTSLWTILGNDDDAKRIAKDVFPKEGVSDRFIEFDAQKRTNYSVILSYQAERTILVYHAPRTYKFPELSSAAWVYFTSMGEGWESVIPDLKKYVTENSIKLAFNPGTYQLMPKSLPALKEVLSFSKIVFLNFEEAMKILETDKKVINNLLEGIQKLGPKTVVITDGKKGAFAKSESGMFFAPTTPGRPIERTGSGDSFATAVLSALFYGKELPEALLWGSVNAASVIQFIGSREGLLTKQEMKKKVAKYKKFKAKIL